MGLAIADMLEMWFFGSLSSSAQMAHPSTRDLVPQDELPNVRKGFRGEWPVRTPEEARALIARANLAPNNTQRDAILREQSLCPLMSPLIAKDSPIENFYKQHVVESLHVLKEGVYVNVWTATVEQIKQDKPELHKRYDQAPSNHLLTSLGEAGATDRPVTTADGWTTIMKVHAILRRLGDEIFDARCCAVDAHPHHRSCI